MRVETMDRDWKLRRKDFGDGEYLYLVDEQDKAVVFNPSANAHTHFQTKPIFEKEWKFKIKAGQELGEAALKKIVASCSGDSVDTYITSTLPRRHMMKKQSLWVTAFL